MRVKIDLIIFVRVSTPFGSQTKNTCNQAYEIGLSWATDNMSVRHDLSP
nr:hypothetical protein [Tanacetum cinerariifolium]